MEDGIRESAPLDADFYYEESQLPNINGYSRLISPNANQTEESKIIHLENCYGFDVRKRHNVHFVKSDVMVSVLGNGLLFFELNSDRSWTWHGLREGNLGAVAIHPTEPYLAVAESNVDGPLIYILQSQTMRVYRILRDGTSRQFTDLAFSHNGNKLASVGGDPDYLLTVWDWRNEKIELRSKAFSQDVYKVAFSPESEDVIITAGMAHIRFWTLSMTFTGLKLQGQIGKFGVTELSDIVSFVQLPAGKVLSSTETGNLLVWDDGTIKFEIAAKGKKPCHQGRVEGVYLFDSEIYSIGADGYLRVWDLEAVDAADSAAQTTQGLVNSARVVELDPIDQILVSKEAHLVGLARIPNTESDFVLQDANGRLYKLDRKLRNSEVLASFHSGKVVGLQVPPTSHTAATLGEDGTLRLYQLLGRATKWTSAYKSFTVSQSPGTALATLPRELDRSGSISIVGFEDGVIRLLAASPSLAEPALIHALKPHKAAVKSIAVSPDGRFIASLSSDGTLFLIRLFRYSIHRPDEELEPTASSPFTHENTKLLPVGFLSLDALGAKSGASFGRVYFSPDNHERDFEVASGGAGAGIQTDDSKADLELDAKLRVSNVAARLLVQMSDGELKLVQVPNALLDPSRQDSAESYALPCSAISVIPWRLEQNEEQLKLQEQLYALENARSEQNNGASGSGMQSQEARGDADANVDKAAESIKRRDTWAFTAVEYIEGGHVIFGSKHTVEIDNLKPTVEFEVRVARLDRPRRSRLLVKTHEPVTFLQFTSSQLYLLIGTALGTVCVAPLRTRDIALKDFLNGHETTPLIKSNAWVYAAHRGAVTGLAATFDDSFIVSSGVDGTVYLFKNESQSVLPESNEEVRIGEQAVDIVDPSAYTLEDTKRRLGQDRMDQVSRRKKEEKRALIKTLKDEFKKIKHAIGDHAVLQQIDPFLQEEMARSAAIKKKEIADSLAWNSEKAHLGLAKVKDYYLGNVDSLRQTVSALARPNVSVATFRTTSLVPEVQTLSDDGKGGHSTLASSPSRLAYSSTNEDLISRADVSALAKSVSTVGSPDNNRSLFTRGSLLASPNVTVSKPGTVSKDFALGLDSCPTPQDLTAAARSEGNHAGTAGDGVLTRSLNSRADAGAKPHERELDSREAAKAKRLEQWKTLLERKPDDTALDPQEELLLEQARNALGDFKLKSDPNYVVPADEQVDASHKQVEAQLLVRAIHNLESGFNRKVLLLAKQREGLLDELQKALPQFIQYFSLASNGESWPETLTFLKPKEPVASASSESFPELQIHLKSELDRLRKRMERLVVSFDAEVDSLLRERSLLEGDIKLAQARLLLLYREWSLLKEFEKQDIAIAKKFSEKARERDELTLKIRVCEDKLLAKKHDMENIQLLQREILTAFQKTFAAGPAGRHFDYMLKVFKRKIKRRKTPNNGNGAGRKRVNWSRVGTAIQGGLIQGSRPETMQDILRHVNGTASSALDDNGLGGFGSGGRESRGANLTESRLFNQSVAGDVEFRASRGNDSLRQSRPSGTAGDPYATERLDASIYDDDASNDLDENLSEALSSAESLGSEDGDLSSDVGDRANGGSSEDLEAMPGIGSGAMSSVDEDFEEVKPADLDQNTWDQLLQLRNTRVDLEAAVADIQKYLDTVRKEFDTLNRRQRLVESMLQGVAQEAQEFRTMKQKRLNELEVIVLLRLHQIQFFDAESCSLPTDLSKALVVYENTLSNLEQRIKELQVEKVNVRKQQKEFHRHSVNLVRGNAERQEQLVALDSKLKDVQMLKFGHLVDLEKLELIGQNKDAEEMLRKQHEFEVAREAELVRFKRQIDDTKQRVLQETRRNTEILEKLVQLSNAKKHIENELDANQRNIKADFFFSLSSESEDSQQSSSSTTLNDCERLKQVISKQAARIDVLRAEIEDLVRKPMREYPIKFKSTAAPITSAARPSVQGKKVTQKDIKTLNESLLQVKAHRVLPQRHNENNSTA